MRSAPGREITFLEIITVTQVEKEVSLRHGACRELVYREGAPGA